MSRPQITRRFNSCSVVIVLPPTQARDNLELSFVNEADMVFTTLSSTGRRVRSKSHNLTQCLT